MAPAHCGQFVIQKSDQVVAVGGGLFTQHEVALVYTVVEPVSRQLRVDDARERRQDIVNGNHFVAFARSDFPRPLDHTRHAQ